MSPFDFKAYVQQGTFDQKARQGVRQATTHAEQHGLPVDGYTNTGHAHPTQQAVSPEHPAKPQKSA
jgi:hypothetical protein